MCISLLAVVVRHPLSFAYDMERHKNIDLLDIFTVRVQSMITLLK